MPGNWTEIAGTMPGNWTEIAGTMPGNWTEIAGTMPGNWTEIAGTMPGNKGLYQKGLRTSLLVLVPAKGKKVLFPITAQSSSSNEVPS